MQSANRHANVRVTTPKQIKFRDITYNLHDIIDDKLKADKVCNLLRKGGFRVRRQTHMGVSIIYKSERK